jgi:hypothetical protein
MNHAYAKGIGVIGIVDFDNPAVFPDFSLFRLVQAEQHTHQCGLSGTVFSKQGMDLTLSQSEGNVIIGDNAGEFFCNMKHFNNIIFHIYPLYLFNFRSRIGFFTYMGNEKGERLSLSP